MGTAKNRAGRGGLLLAVVLAVVLLCCPASANDNNTIVIANGEWVPYMSEHMPHYGPVNRVITEAFALEGVQVEYRWMPWKRAFEEAKEGGVAATSGWIRNGKRELYFYFSDVLFVTKKVFFHRRDFPFDWETLEDLRGLRIGAVLGYSYGVAFDGALEKEVVAVQRVAEERTNFEKLLRRRIHLYPQELEVGLAHVETFKPEERALLTYHSKPLLETQYYLLFSRRNAGNEELVKAFNRGLGRLRKSGKLQKYLGTLTP